MSNKMFIQGEILQLCYIATQKTEKVNFRGLVNFDQAVVVKDGYQFAVKLSDLKRIEK